VPVKPLLHLSLFMCRVLKTGAQITKIFLKSRYLSRK
jgi:hypothetical protein